MIPDNVRTDILARMHSAEKEHGVRILLAVDIMALLERKRKTPELGLDLPVPSINAFVEADLARLETYEPPAHLRGDVLPKLNEIFHQILSEKH